MSGDWVPIQELQSVDDGKWCGQIAVPNKRFPLKIIVYEFNSELRAIARLCPHQSYDLIACEVSDGGIIHCPLHHLPISILAKKSSYEIKKEGNKFLCYLSPPVSSGGAV